MYGAWKLGQSLGDVARDSRERKKATATKVITDEDLEPKKPGSTSGLDKELDRMRKILLAICDDPKTEHGRNLSDYDKKTITDGVKPLRSAWPSTRASRKKYKDDLAEMETYYEAEFQKTFSHDRPAGHRSCQSSSTRVRRKKAKSGQSRRTRPKGLRRLPKTTRVRGRRMSAGS
jgi:hypothetical protein